MNDLNKVLGVNKPTIRKETDNSYNIYIRKGKEVLPWKKFNSNMAISVEYDLEY